MPEAVRALLGAATPEAYLEHEELLVGDGPDDTTELDWRRTPDGTLHAATLEGVAAGLAWAAGQWPRRFEVAALLEDPDRGGGTGTGAVVRLTEGCHGPGPCRVAAGAGARRSSRGAA